MEENKNQEIAQPEKELKDILVDKKSEIENKAQEVAQEAILPSYGNFFKGKDKHARAAVIRAERDAEKKSQKHRRIRRKLQKASRKANRKK
jgi:hypothetical protein